MYKAVLTLVAKPGFTFTGVPANAFRYSGAASVTNAADSGTVTITFPATAGLNEDTMVHALSLDGLVTAPVKNTEPLTVFVEQTQYIGTIAWQTESGASVEGNFEASTVYKAVLTLVAKPGFTFTGVQADSFSYRGATVTNAADSGTVTITFPATAGVNEVTIVHALSLDGLVTAPVKGAAPVTAFAEQTQYTGTIRWQTESGDSVEGSFTASTVYKAVLTLTAKEGFTFIGVPANAFSYTGAASVTNAANSRTVTITFPATAGAGSYRVSGTLSNAAETIGGRNFGLQGDFSGVTVRMVPAAGGAAITGSVSGSTYTVTGLQAGTYLLEAETGPYDYAAKVTVADNPAQLLTTHDAALVVFPGLKMTVKIPKTSPAFILPVKTPGSGLSIYDVVEVDLEVDWGDGSDGVRLSTRPGSTADPAYTHDYQAAVGDAKDREFTIRIKGKCWGSEASGTFTTNGRGKFGMTFRNIGVSDWDQASGFALGENKNKLVRLAGNITALTNPNPSNNAYAYFYAFQGCANLEDISGLVFTDTGESGDYFMGYLFSECPNLTETPPDFVPPGLTPSGDDFLQQAFDSCIKLGVLSPGFLPAGLTEVGDGFLNQTFSNCRRLTEIPGDFLPDTITTVGQGFLVRTFRNTGITVIPEGFLPAALETAGSSFLSGTFEGCNLTATLEDLTLPGEG